MIILLAIGLVILIMVLIGLAVDKKEEAADADETEKEERIKAETEIEAVALALIIRNSFQDWWRNSRFNNFIVLEKRTPMHFNGKRYMAVRHAVTNECYNLEVDVTTYFNHDVGAEISMTNIKYDYITEEALAEFTAETGVTVSLELLQSAWAIEETLGSFCIT